MGSGSRAIIQYAVETIRFGKMGKLSATDIVNLLPAIKEIREDIDVDFDSYFHENNNKK